MTDHTLTRLLRLCARVEWDAGHSRALVDAADRLTDWDSLPPAAAAHGLSSLVSRHLAEAGIDPPVTVRQELFAMGCLVGTVNRGRFRVLRDILDVFSAAGVPVVVLKGAALAHLIYPSVALRPLSDIDLLIDRSMAAKAMTALRGLELGVPWYTDGSTPVGHHHLPAAVAVVDGVEVRVELHINALTRDAPGSLSLRELSSPPQPFLVEGRTAFALGHTDMLYHLCRHLAEPSRLLRLIWVADIVEYASRYREDIQWDELHRRHPFVLNALALLHLVTELPGPLLPHVAVSTATPIRGVGTGCKPLSEIFGRRPFRHLRQDLFDPSDWWLRLYYGLDDRAPLWWYRCVHHPLRVSRWLARRAAHPLFADRRNRAALTL